MPKFIMSVAQADDLYAALPDICQFIETFRDDYPETFNDVLATIDLADDAFDDSYAALCDVIGYKPGERPDDECAQV